MFDLMILFAYFAFIAYWLHCGDLERQKVRRYQRLRARAIRRKGTIWE